MRGERPYAAMSPRPSALAGLHPTYMSMIERGIRNPTLDVSARIAKALNVGLPKLIEEAQHPRANGGKKEWRMPNFWEAIRRRSHDRLCHRS